MSQNNHGRYHQRASFEHLEVNRLRSHHARFNDLSAQTLTIPKVQAPEGEFENVVVNGNAPLVPDGNFCSVLPVPDDGTFLYDDQYFRGYLQISLPGDVYALDPTRIDIRPGDIIQTANTHGFTGAPHFRQTPPVTVLNVWPPNTEQFQNGRWKIDFLVPDPGVVGIGSIPALLAPFPQFTPVTFTDPDTGRRRGTTVEGLHVQNDAWIEGNLSVGGHAIHSTGHVEAGETVRIGALPLAPGETPDHRDGGGILSWHPGTDTVNYTDSVIKINRSTNAPAFNVVKGVITDITRNAVVSTHSLLVPNPSVTYYGTKLFSTKLFIDSTEVHSYKVLSPNPSGSKFPREYVGVMEIESQSTPDIAVGDILQTAAGSSGSFKIIPVTVVINPPFQTSDPYRWFVQFANSEDEAENQIVSDILVDDMINFTRHTTPDIQVGDIIERTGTPFASNTTVLSAPTPFQAAPGSSPGWAVEFANTTAEAEDKIHHTGLSQGDDMTFTRPGRRYMKTETNDQGLTVYIKEANAHTIQERNVLLSHKLSVEKGDEYDVAGAPDELNSYLLFVPNPLMGNYSEHIIIRSDTPPDIEVGDIIQTADDNFAPNVMVISLTALNNEPPLSTSIKFANGADNAATKLPKPLSSSTQINFTRPGTGISRPYMKTEVHEQGLTVYSKEERNATSPPNAGINLPGLPGNVGSSSHETLIQKRNVALLPHKLSIEKGDENDVADGPGEMNSYLLDVPNPSVQGGGGGGEGAHETGESQASSASVSDYSEFIVIRTEYPSPGPGPRPDPVPDPDIQVGDIIQTANNLFVANTAIISFTIGDQGTTSIKFAADSADAYSKLTGPLEAFIQIEFTRPGTGIPRPYMKTEINEQGLTISLKEADGIVQSGTLTLEDLNNLSALGLGGQGSAEGINYLTAFDSGYYLSNEIKLDTSKAVAPVIEVTHTVQGTVGTAFPEAAENQAILYPHTLSINAHEASRDATLDLDGSLLTHAGIDELNLLVPANLRARVTSLEDNLSVSHVVVGAASAASDPTDVVDPYQTMIYDWLTVALKRICQLEHYITTNLSATAAFTPYDPAPVWTGVVNYMLPDGVSTHSHQPPTTFGPLVGIVLGSAWDTDVAHNGAPLTHWWHSNLQNGMDPILSVGDRLYAWDPTTQQIVDDPRWTNGTQVTKTDFGNWPDPAYPHYYKNVFGQLHSSVRNINNPTAHIFEVDPPPHYTQYTYYGPGDAHDGIRRLLTLRSFRTEYDDNGVPIINQLMTDCLPTSTAP